ncbi:MAG: SAM-dependent methyltransferase [Desulfosarcinaceae bacterium]|nr:SAM-dependent methyltransferase [Desulfosarcinaceae bacterium]
MTATISQMAIVTAYLRAFAHVELYGGDQAGDWLAHHFLPPDWAQSLHSPEMRDHAKANVMQPGMYAYLTARTAHIDALFRRSIEDGCRQVVILGAGCDTRAQRLLLPESDCRVFELDTPATQQYKRSCLEKVSHIPCSAVRYLAVDLREVELETALADIGATPAAETLFVLEGLTMYLPCPSVSAILNAIRGWACAGSRLVMDYLQADVLSGDTSRYGAAGLLQKAEGHGEPLRCGYTPEEIEETAKAAGYGVHRHLHAAELTARCLSEVDTQLTGPISECFSNLVLVVET